MNLIKNLSVLDWLVEIAAFVVFIYPLLDFKEIKTRIKDASISWKKKILLKEIILLFIGLFVMIVTLFSSSQQNTDKETLNGKIETLVKDHKYDTLNIVSLKSDNVTLQNLIDSIRKDSRDYHSSTVDILAKNYLGLTVKSDANTNKLDTQIVRLTTDEAKKNKEIDSLKIKGEGNVLIVPDEYILKVDTLTNRLDIKLLLCNNGDMVAKNAIIDIMAESKKDMYTRFSIGNYRQDFAANHDCYEFHIPTDKLNLIADPRQYIIVYRIAYTNSKGLKEFSYHIIMYSYELKQWIFPNKDYSYLFN